MTEEDKPVVENKLELTNSVKVSDKLDETNKSENYVCDDPVILDAFSDVKAAILSQRTDIVRQILSAAQSCM